MNARRQTDVLLRLFNGVYGLSERNSFRQVERKRHHRELPLMVHGDGSGLRGKLRKGAQRNLRTVRRMHKNLFQRVGILLERGIHFQDDMVLIELRENRGYLTLAKS